MTKFYVIPKVEIAMEIEKNKSVRTKNDAMQYFADFMSLDMNEYFDAVTEEEFNCIKNKKENS